MTDSGDRPLEPITRVFSERMRWLHGNLYSCGWANTTHDWSISSTLPPARGQTRGLKHLLHLVMAGRDTKHDHVMWRHRDVE